ncbi:MAG: discoidin domain-containing protein [Akkermansiaceae bacterium]|jgi:hypothetical protein
MRSFLPLLALASTAIAKPTRSLNFVEATALAKKSERPVAVYVHGSSWHGASKRFRDLIWKKPEFADTLTQPIILTSIEVKQHFNKEAAAKHDESDKGWKDKSVRTYPAIQVYGFDGHLLTTLSGADLRSLSSMDALADRLDKLSELANQRRDLLQEATAAEDSEKLNLLAQLADLPLNNEPKIIAQFKNLDPEDKTGWQARLSFKNWDFVRHITGLVNGDKHDEALAEIEKQLSVPDQSPVRLALIHGAKGRVLASQNKLSDAWITFQKAHQYDPKGPNGITMLAYGTRVAGVPLREVLPADSTLNGKDIGDNISRDHATVTLSSASNDDPTQHAHLFNGPYAKVGFAIHTDAEKDAHGIVDLQEICQVQALRIINRRTQSGRAKTLTVWTSADQKTWQKIWAADKAEFAWDILLEKPVAARYLKVGLNSPKPEYLSLQAIDIFGSR